MTGTLVHSTRQFVKNRHIVILLHTWNLALRLASSSLSVFCSLLCEIVCAFVPNQRRYSQIRSKTSLTEISLPRIWRRRGIVSASLPWKRSLVARIYAKDAIYVA